MHYLWDPIGVRGSPGARDEYYSYVPHVFSLVKNKAGEDAVAEYLISVERDRMGLSPTPNRAREVAGIMIEFRELIYQDAL